MTYTAQLIPSPRQSPGLIDAYTDIVGGDYVQDNVSGNQSSLNFNGLQAQFSVVAGGPTGKQIVIPQNWYGGNIVWVRGLYATSAVARYASFMSDFSSGDTTNYADFTQAATNTYSAGSLSTTIPVLAAVAVGTTLQAYYSYRTAVQTVKGQSIESYPMIHIDPYQGTANDGDDYMMHALYHAYRVTQDQKYKAMADKIGQALLDAGTWSSNVVDFDIPFDQEAGQFGVYWYNSPGSPMIINLENSPGNIGGKALYLSVNVTAGNYAGVGMWPSFPVSAQSPLNSIDFNIYGDGSTRNLVLTTTVNAIAVSALIPLMPTNISTWASFSISPSMFWQTTNVVYDAQHVTYAYTTPYGSNSFAINNVADTTNNYIIEEFSWNFAGNPGGYAGYSFGTASGSSAGTTALNFDIYVSSAGTYTISATDNTSTKYSVNIALSAGWNIGKSIPWATFHAGFVHPVKSFNFDVPTAITSGTARLNNVRYDSVVALSSMTYTSISGFQFEFPVSTGGAYSIYFENWTVNQNLIDGPSSEPMRYVGIPRWTYKWVYNASALGYGSWRGPSGCGYLWLGGWYSSGLYTMQNQKVISTSIMDFLTDSQNAYATQFPAQTKGPFINLYGRASWESLITGGYVANVYQSSTYNQWYFSSTSDWYGYNYRALLSVAQYYYLTGSSQAKAILDNWMTWINTKLTASGGYWRVPSGFNSDGTLTYGFGTYGPVYGHACIAAACMYKYFVDGDTIAQTWYRRCLDTMFNGFRLTGTGSLAGIYPAAEGTGYTTATVNFTVNVGATAPTATAFIAGGKITHYVVNTPGSGITSLSMTITGDGTGAQGNAYLTDKLVGAFGYEHTGWEAAEIYNTYALLVNGPPPGGLANHQLSSTANDVTAMTGLYSFYVNNTTDTRPSMRTSALMPLHEYNVGSWHWNTGIENPMSQNTEVKGGMWTETIAPSLYMAVEYYRYSKDKTWLDTLYNLLLEFTGGTVPLVSNYFVPNSISKESQIWEGTIHFMRGKAK